MTSAAESRFGRPRVWHREVGSTIDVAAFLAANGAPHGTLVETAFQTAGRGRRGRRWEAPPGSALLASWVMRPPVGHDAGVLSPLFALALLRAIRRLCPDISAGYKWPNDIWIGDRKVAGILLSARHGADGNVVIAGTGVNVVRPPHAPDGSAWLGDWVAGARVDIVRDTLATELDAMWARYQVSGALGDDDIAALEAATVWRGELVEVRETAGPVRGVMVGIERDGSLVLLPEGGGDPVILRAGEVVRGPRIPAQERPNGAVYFPEQETG